MTNIGVLGKKNEAGDVEFFLAVADSQSTSDRSKSDSALKMNSVGDERNILCLSSGSCADQASAVSRLRALEGIRTVDAAAENLLELTHKLYALETKDNPQKIADDVHRGNNFLLVGPSNEGLSAIHVDTLGSSKPTDRVMYENRGLSRLEISPGHINCMFKGSGREMVMGYILGRDDVGRPVRAETITDGLIEMHDFGQKGARALGCNGCLQYGIVTPRRTVRLIDSRVAFDDVIEYAEYVGALTGLDARKILKVTSKDPTEAICAKDSYVGMDSFIDDFYQAVNNDLGEATRLRWALTRAGDDWMRDDAYKPRFEKLIDQNRSACANVSKAVGAILSWNPDAIREYIADFRARQDEVNESVLWEFNRIGAIKE